MLSLILLHSSGVIDSGVACCGMAGDRGMRFPEVIESSTAPARTKIESRSGGIGVCVSSSRTCEAAMSQGTGRGFVSVMHVLDACSKPKASVAAPS
jgi:D-lactate dehydrogenase